MDYNDNEEKTLNLVNTLNKGVWRGDSRTCEQRQVIYSGPVITRPDNMNEVDNQSANDLNKPIRTTGTNDQPTSKPVTIPNENMNLKENEESNQSNNSNNKSSAENQPIRFGFTNSQPIRLSLSSSSDSSDNSKTTTWGQVKNSSPKKKKGNKKSPESSPTKNKNCKAMTSWKNVSPTKSSSSSDLEHSSHSNHSNEYAPRIFRFSTSRLKELSDSTSSSETEASYQAKKQDGAECPKDKHVSNKEEESGSCNCSPKKGSPCKKSGSCNCSNNCTSHLPDNQNALVNSNSSSNENGSPKKERGVNGTDDACDNEYFYEDDFTVQFDTNLRETSVTPIDSDPSTTILDFPNMVSGSYLHFANGGSSNVSFNTCNSKASSNVSLNNIMRVSNIINNQEERVQYDSEFSGNSGSHNSTMEMSSSDRDMMGSSDIIDLSDGPLFTPTPTQNLADSLDKNGRDALDGGMSGSDGSGEANLNVDCCPRKEEYFLSFDGSQSRVSGSDTDISLSHELYQGHWVQSVQSEASVTSHDSEHIYTSQGHDASNEFSSSEGQEESTDSFHMCFNKLSPRHKNNQYAGRENLSNRMMKKLVPVKETIAETGDSSEDENARTSTTLTAGSKDVSSGASPQTSPKKKLKILGEQINHLKGKKSGQLFLVGIGKPEDILRKAGVHSHTLPKIKKLVSWKQLKNFKKGDFSKCASLPELNTSTSWQNISALKCRKLSDISQSFHGKRHSASLLEFYQRMKSQSNPVSPETMNNIEQILWPNFIEQKSKPEMSDSSGSSQEYGQCHCGKHNVVNGLPDSGVKGYSNKRIYDWLKMEASGSLRPNSLACQTGATSELSSKETLISPQTVTLWCGTKTVASQFPPVTKDCAMQTFQTQQNIKGDCGILSGISKRDQALQTSDFEEEEILSILSDNFEDYSCLKSNEGIAKDLVDCPDVLFVEKDLMPKLHRSKSADGYRSKSNRLSNCTNKSYQQRTSHFGRSKSTGRLSSTSELPGRRMGLSRYYTQQSLPDIAFLSSSVSIEKEESKDSLFDVMKIDLPVPVTIVPKTELEQFNIYKQTASPCQHKSTCCTKFKNKGTDTEIGSSSSGISTSSASSGIDPGYCDCRSRSSESPQNDLERLIFFPPHTEEKIKAKDCCGAKRRAKSLPSRLSECANSNNPKLEKYANETRPQVIPKGQGQCRINEKWISAGKKVDKEVGDNLYALEEEQTPVASPDQPCCHGNTCKNVDLKSTCSSDSGAKCNFFCGEPDFTESDFYRAVEADKIIVVGNDYYHGLGLGTDSNSSSGSSVPHIGRKPLKSCLRKRNRGLKSRSMSATDTMALNFDDLEQKVKNHRHSYGCDEVYIVSDEHGQLMMYQADDSAEPVMFYLGKDGECHMTEGHRNHMENFGSLANFNIQATDSIHASDSSTDKEGNNKRKSVSFASEVSFQSISPAMSPKHQSCVSDAARETTPEKDAARETTPEKDAARETTPEKDAADTQEVSKDTAKDSGKEAAKGTEEKDMKGEPGKELETGSLVQAVETGEGTGSCSSSDCAPDEFHVAMDTNDNLWFEDVMMEKMGLLMSVSKAADVLSAHFENSKDTFDKLRLGNTSETPELGEIVLTRLCTSLTAVLGDGLKHHLAGFQMFGSVQITVWKVVEASTEIVPQTRSLCDLVQRVKQTSYLTTQQQKFDAFIFGLLNLRVLDYWMGYLQQKEEQLSKFYNSGAILVHSNGALKKQYDDLVLSIQKLAVLPFHMDTEFIKEKSLSDSKFKSQEMVGSSEGMVTVPANQINVSDSSSNQNSSKESSSVLEITASKALSWLANAALPRRKTQSDSDLTETRSRTAGRLESMSDSSSMSSQSSGSFSFHDDAEEDLNKQIEHVYENLGETQKLLYKDARMSSVDCDPIISPSDSMRSSQNSQTGFASLFSTMAARFGDSSGNQSLTQSMTSSATSLVTRLTGLQFGSSQKTYKKGVTEYKFQEEDVVSDKPTKDGNVSKIEDAAATLTGNTESDEKLCEKANENICENSKRVSFDIVNLFDKLLLPSTKPEKKEQKPVSKIPRPTNRWSWSFGMSKTNAGSPTNSPAKLPKASTDTNINKQPTKPDIGKCEPVVPKNEHFPKRNGAPTNRTSSCRSAKPSRNGTNKVTGPPKPPRLVQSASSVAKKSSNTSLEKQSSQRKNAATL